jgi:hypothetical protein
LLDVDIQVMVGKGTSARRLEHAGILGRAARLYMALAMRSFSMRKLSKRSAERRSNSDR